MKIFILIAISILAPEIILLIIGIISDMFGKNKIALKCYTILTISLPIKPIKNRIKYICGLKDTDYCKEHNSCKYKYCPFKEYSDKNYNIKPSK